MFKLITFFFIINLLLCSLDLFFNIIQRSQQSIKIISSSLPSVLHNCHDVITDIFESVLCCSCDLALLMYYFFPALRFSSASILFTHSHSHTHSLSHTPHHLTDKATTDMHTQILLAGPILLYLELTTLTCV